MGSRFNAQTRRVASLHHPPDFRISLRDNYIFGTLLLPNAPLRYFFSEGTTAYLALKATQHQLGPRLYREKLAGYRQRPLRHVNSPALADVRRPDAVDDAYRYVAAPL